jgi:cobalt-zinc-cadmium efflux system membrane fusion protein
MNKIQSIFIISSLLTAASLSQFSYAGSHHGGEEQHKEEEAKGPNNGKLLAQGDLTLELQLFENGLPPEYRIFASYKGAAIEAKNLDVSMQLIRLGDKTDNISFAPQGEYLRGDTVIYEPHSFVVNVQAEYQGQSYQWHYDNFEGRTQISDSMANEMGIQTELVSAQTMQVTTKVFGQLVLPESSSRHVMARYPGKVTQLNVVKGQRVKKGQALMRVQSNDSLQSYTLYAPITGVISEQNISSGEQTTESVLLTIVDLTELHAELQVFPSQQEQVKIGAQVNMQFGEGDQVLQGEIWDALSFMNAQQAKTVRVKVDNSAFKFLPGQFVEADIVTDEFVAPLAVKTTGLQAFRDFTVIYAKVGEQYEVRMLELGRQSGDWVEVLSGITAGTEYVSHNSYIIKADIEKSGAAHDH